jgi:LysR family transcriptional activator of glutamate synthase operon
MDINSVIPTLDLQKLQFFCTVSYTDSITQAAEILHVSQSYLSKCISSLEKRLGVELFERSGNRIRLNSYGMVFRKRAEAAIAEINNGLNEINALQRQRSMQVSISTSNYEITTMIEQFIIDHPNYTMFHTVKSLLELKILLMLGTLDFGIITCDDTGEFSDSSIVAERLVEDEVMLLVSASSEFANCREGVSLKDLAGKPFVLAKGPLEYPREICRFLYDSEYSPRIMLESYNTNTTRRMVANGLAYSFITLVEWYELKTSRDKIMSGTEIIKKGTRAIRIRDNGCKRMLYLISNRNHVLSKGALAFKEYTLNYFAQIRDYVGTLLSNGSGEARNE